MSSKTFIEHVKAEVKRKIDANNQRLEEERIICQDIAKELINMLGAEANYVQVKDHIVQQIVNDSDNANGLSAYVLDLESYVLDEIVQRVVERCAQNKDNKYRTYYYMHKLFGGDSEEANEMVINPLISQWEERFPVKSAVLDSSYFYDIKERNAKLGKNGKDNVCLTITFDAAAFK